MIKNGWKHDQSILETWSMIYESMIIITPQVIHNPLILHDFTPLSSYIEAWSRKLRVFLFFIVYSLIYQVIYANNENMIKGILAYFLNSIDSWTHINCNQALNLHASGKHDTWSLIRRSRLIHKFRSISSTYNSLDHFSDSKCLFYPRFVNINPSTLIMLLLVLDHISCQGKMIMAIMMNSVFALIMFSLDMIISVWNFNTQLILTSI